MVVATRVHEVQDWLRRRVTHGDPITFSGSHVQRAADRHRPEGSLNLPLELWVRYVTCRDG